MIPILPYLLVCALALVAPMFLLWFMQWFDARHYRMRRFDRNGRPK